MMGIFKYTKLVGRHNNLLFIELIIITLKILQCNGLMTHLINQLTNYIVLTESSDLVLEVVAMIICRKDKKSCGSKDEK